MIEITANIFKQADEFDASARLIDKILDVAGSKGTGSWTVQEASRRAVPCSTIQASLDMRYSSVSKDTRLEAAKVYSKQTARPCTGLDKEKFVQDVKDALYCSKVCAYAQGMALLSATSQEKGWNMDLADVARGWKGGCIIRAKLLDWICDAYKDKKVVSSLLLDKV